MGEVNLGGEARQHHFSDNTNNGEYALVLLYINFNPPVLFNRNSHPDPTTLKQKSVLARPSVWLISF